MTRLTDLRVLLLDAQTTGASPARGRLLELAWAVVSAAAADAVAVESAVIAGPDGSDPVAPRILKMTGLSAEMVAAGITAAAARQALDATLRSAAPDLAVAHFARFETPFVEALWRAATDEPFPLRYVCTHALSQRLYPDLPSRSLRAVAGFLGWPVDQAKRAGAHVEATAHIWRRLVAELEAREGVTKLAELTAWLQRKVVMAPAKASVRRYAMSRDVRLALPDSPGVYRMLASDGRVLYVGKATSLRSRVNSYFRQRQGHSSQKRELVAQIFDVDTEVCASPLEAALLESDEIKRLAPPYNVALQSGARQVGFYDRDLRQAGDGDSYCYGPFARQDALAGVTALAALAAAERQAAGEALKGLVYGDVTAEVLDAGLALFTAAWPSAARGPRALLAAAIREARRLAAARAAAGDATDDADDAEGLAEEPAASTEARPVAPDDIAEMLRGAVVGSGFAWLRSRRVRKLMNVVVAWRAPSPGEARLAWRFLVVVDGRCLDRGFAPSPPAFAAPDLPALPRPERPDISTYDRVRVLATEVARLVAEGQDVVLRFPQGVFDGMDRRVSPPPCPSPEDDRAKLARVPPRRPRDRSGERGVLL